MARQVKARATQPDNVIDVQNSCGEDRKLIPEHQSSISCVCPHTITYKLKNRLHDI